jgi:hypothetical protein
VEGLHPYIRTTGRAVFGLAGSRLALDALVHGVSDGKREVFYDHEEAEEVGDGHEDDHGDAVPPDDGRDGEDGVGGDDDHHAEGPEDLLALKLLGAAVDCLVLLPAL